MPEAIDAAPSRRRAAIIFIFFTVVLDVLTFSVVIPVLPQLVTGLADGNAVLGATMYGVMSASWAFAQFFASPVLGRLSDQFGRRPLILFSNLGIALSYVATALAPTLPLFLASRLISGITSSSIPAANAYIADITAPEQRAQAFGMLGAAFGIGFIMGPSVGGILGEIDPHLPLWVAAGLAALNFCYGYFVLPESLPKERRRPFDMKAANPFATMSVLRRNARLVGLACVQALYQFGFYVFPATWVLIATHRYGWGPTPIGLLMGFNGMLSILIQGVLVRRVVGWLGERGTLALSLGGGAVGLALYALAVKAWMVPFAVLVMALWGFYTPSVQALFTRQVGPSEQGALQGALSSVNGVVGMIAPLVYTNLFAFSISKAAPMEAPGRPGCWRA